MFTKTLLSIALVGLATCQHVRAAEYDWANTATDFDAKTSYTQGGTGTIAGSNVAFFKTAETVQPALSASISVGGLNFSASGYDVTGASGTVLTLTGYGTSATGATASAGAAVYSTSTGANTFDVPVTLASGSTTSAPSTIYQPGVGGSLIFNGAISGTTNLNVNLAATSTVAFNGDNSGFSGTVTLTGTNVTGGAATLAVGSNTALGTGALIFNSSNATLAAVNGARTLANALSLAGPGVVGGTNNLIFTGVTTASGALTRTLIVSNTGATTFAGSVFLSESATTARTLVLTGTGAVNVSGVIADFNGTGLAGNLSYTGTNTLTLAGANTYSGTTTVGSTTVTGGMLTVLSTSKLGAGNVTINDGNTLTLSTGVTNAIANTATLTLGTTATGTNAILALNGTAGTSQETVNGLIVNGTALAAGTYGPTGDKAANFQLANITGTGELTVLTLVAVPEPSTWVVLLGGLGLCGVAARRTRRRRA